MAITAQQRLNVQWLLDQHLPFRRGDKGYAEICRGYRQQGTTCGFLVHWLLWRLGCGDPDLVNRPEVAGNVSFSNNFRIFDKGPQKPRQRNADGIVTGGNLSMLNEHPKTRHNPLTVQPQMGDIILVDDPAHVLKYKDDKSKVYLHQHVFIFLETISQGSGAAWRTAEAGRAGAQAANGALEADFGIRSLLRNSGKVEMRQNLSGTRVVIGWLSLDDVVFNDPPQPLKYR